MIRKLIRKLIHAHERSLCNKQSHVLQSLQPISYYKCNRGCPNCKSSNYAPAPIRQFKVKTLSHTYVFTSVDLLRIETLECLICGNIYAVGPYSLKEVV